jgi:methylated-DNA-protein-cysteine methyltransferase-like protein
MSKEEGRLPDYFSRVYDVARMIPEGRVTTYGAIADFLALGSARMVGWALNRCFDYAIDIPAHRVVNRKGELSGRIYFTPIGQMEAQLEKEGVQIENDRVVNFKQVFWSPMEIQGV